MDALHLQTLTLHRLQVRPPGHESHILARMRQQTAEITAHAPGAYHRDLHNPPPDYNDDPNRTTGSQ